MKGTSKMPDDRRLTFLIEKHYSELFKVKTKS